MPSSWRRPRAQARRPDRLPCTAPPKQRPWGHRRVRLQPECDHASPHATSGKNSERYRQMLIGKSSVTQGTRAPDFRYKCERTLGFDLAAAPFPGIAGGPFAAVPFPGIAGGPLAPPAFAPPFGIAGGPAGFGLLARPFGIAGGGVFARVAAAGSGVFGRGAGADAGAGAGTGAAAASAANFSALSACCRLASVRHKIAMDEVIRGFGMCKG